VELLLWYRPPKADAWIFQGSDRWATASAAAPGLPGLKISRGNCPEIAEKTLIGAVFFTYGRPGE
jgi:hypothetical protein